MSTSSEVVQYLMDSEVSVILPDGSQCNGIIGLSFTPAAGSTVMTDDVVGAVQQALVAAFPPSWGVTNSEMQIAKTDQTTIAYTTDYTSSPPAFA